MAVLDPDAPELAAAARLVLEQVERLSLTPAERAEVLCLALGVPSDVSAAARGVSPGTIRARRLRIRRKLVAMLGQGDDPSRAAPNA
jgi:DNA-binding CsgD family transcriptional regulator